MKITIHTRGHHIVALDEMGNMVANRATYCNPAAIHQIILDVQMIDGAEIDWDRSQVAEPGTVDA